MKSHKINNVVGYDRTGRTLSDEELQWVCGGTTMENQSGPRRITPDPLDEGASGFDGDGVVPIVVA